MSDLLSTLLKEPVKTERNLSGASKSITLTGTVIEELLEARGMLTDFADKWQSLQQHIQSTGGLSTPPFIPNDNQNVAFEINLTKLRKVIEPDDPAQTPDTVACILCINDNFTNRVYDDTVSVMFVGIDGFHKPTPELAVEKWPGIYTNVIPMGTRAQDVKLNILTPAATPSKPNQFVVARNMVDAFVDKWQKLVDDTDGTTSAQRPQIEMQSHPLVFLFSVSQIEALIQTNVTSIAGVFGFVETSNGGYIAPFFVGIDSNYRPVTDILFTQSSSIGYYLSQATQVRQVLLTA